MVRTLLQRFRNGLSFVLLLNGCKQQNFSNTWRGIHGSSSSGGGIIMATALAAPEKPISVPTALVTGSTDGIGVTTARNLLAGNFQNKDNKSNIGKVLVHGRDDDRVRNTVASIQKQTKTGRSKLEASCIGLPAADLSTARGCYDLSRSVLEQCQNESSSGSALKVLVNNAGVYSNRLVHTEDGLELTFAVNVLAPFIITSMLLSTLLANGSSSSSHGGGGASRIVIASSVSQSWRLPNDYWEDPHYHKRSYSAHGAYSESKLLDAMLTMEIADRLKKAGIDPSIVACNCLDPGTVNTKMLLDGWGRIGIDVESALDETWCSVSPELEGVTGAYFVGRSSRKASSDAYDSKERQRLWETLSELAPAAAEEWDRAIARFGSTQRQA